MAHPIFFLEVNLGRLGKVFIETDRDSNSRAHVIELIRSGEHTPVKVIEVDEDAGLVRNVTDEILSEVAALLVPMFADAGDRQAAMNDRARDYRKHEAV